LGGFDLVQVSGFMEVTGDNIGLDVSTNPTINGDAVMKDVVLFTLLRENV
jgi:hypothetical protein